MRVGSSAEKNRNSEVVEIRRKLEDTDSTLLRDLLRQNVSQIVSIGTNLVMVVSLPRIT